jgi:ABC-type glutathione transport system ATPase component
MATTSTSAIGAAQQTTISAKPSREIVLEATANELIVAVVGHVGSGTSEIAEALHNLLEEADLPGGPYEAEVLKARNEIEKWATEAEEALPTSQRAFKTLATRCASRQMMRPP